MRSRREIPGRLLLAIAVILAAWLRFENLGGPSFWLDEILGQMHAQEALRLAWWEWISGFHPEHGPLYYATNVAATDEWSARLPPALFGLVTVLLVWLAGREVSGDPLTAGCAAMLVAVSPLHVYYSREARPYGLVILLTGAVLLALLRRTRGLAPLLLLMLYTSTATASVIATVMVLGLVLWVMDRRSRHERPVPDGPSPFDGRVQTGSSGDLRRTLRGARPFWFRWLRAGALHRPFRCLRAGALHRPFRCLRAGALHHRLICFAPPAQMTTLSAALLSLATLVFIPLLYRRGNAAAPPAVPFPQIDLAFFDRLIRGMAVTVLDSQEGGRTAYGLFALAVVGAIALLRRNRVAGVIVVGFTLLPAAIALVALRLVDHWYAVRYVSPAVIGFTILAACGLAAVATLPARLLKAKPAAGEWISMLLVVLILGTIVTETWTLARREPQRKLDWRGIARAIWEDAHEGDLVMTAEPWSELSLRYYMQRLPPRVTLLRADSVANAEALVARFPAAWLVTSGFAPDVSVRHWMCSQPQLLGGSVEGFRLHYAPSARHYLTTRAGAAELRAASAAVGVEPLRVRMDDDVPFVEGWAMVEGETNVFRWAVGRSASIGLPRSERVDRTVRIHVSPLDAPPLEPQTLQLLVNGTAAQKITLVPGWRDYGLRTPADSWTSGWNVLTFAFGRANAPADLDPSSRDERQLAAAFAGITIEQSDVANGVVRDAPPPVARLASAALLQDAFWDDYDETRFTASDLRREAVEPLLGRLGFDPAAIWPRLASGAMHLEDLLEVAAYGTECLNDDAFLTRTAALLLERELSAFERADLLRAMRADGYTRPRIAVRIGTADEFRSRMLRALTAGEAV